MRNVQTCTLFRATNRKCCSLAMTFSSSFRASTVDNRSHQQARTQLRRRSFKTGPALDTCQSLGRKCEGLIPCTDWSRPGLVCKRRDLNSQRNAIPGQVRQPKDPRPACKECHKRKRRCDRNPTCAGCHSRGVDCRYPINNQAQRPHAPSPRQKISGQDKGHELDLQMEQLLAEQPLLDTGSNPHNITLPKSILCWPSVVILLEETSRSTEHNAKQCDHPQQSLRTRAESITPLRGSSPHCSSPEMTTAVIESYFVSYVEQIHTMHPFLDIHHVRELLDDCIKHDALRVGTRQFDAHEGPNGHWTRQDSPLVFTPPRTSDLDNALILLVLALGEVCEHGKSSLMHQKDGGGEWSTSRNLPGTTWFTRAMTLLLTMSLDRALPHAQVFLLAGLFAAHFDHAKESKSCFAIAGQTLRTLIDASEICDMSIPRAPQCNLSRTKTESLTLIAAWSCLQLENEATPHGMPAVILPSSPICYLYRKAGWREKFVEQRRRSI